MDAFRWDACFVTGLATVDEQHRGLVDLINGFGDLLVQPGGAAPEQLDAVLQRLSQYALHHFREEEGLMAQVGVADDHIAQHCAEHAAFADEVARLHFGTANPLPGGAMPLLEFLVHWLAYHILGMDQAMARQIAAIEAGTPPGEARRVETRDRDPATAMLLRSLQGLFHQVSERNRALFELTQTLEQRVEERTRALSEANQQLEDLALTDVLTGLPNRRCALRQLQAEWQGASRRRAPVSCVMLDADGFKAINDSFGHAAGDAVLQQLGMHLKEAVRTDDTVCRMGGDEFLVVCANTSLEGAIQVAEKLRQHVATLRVRTGSGEWHGSISAGVASRGPGMHDVDDLLKAADQALYTAKRAGRNCVMSLRGRASKRSGPAAED